MRIISKREPDSHNVEFELNYAELHMYMRPVRWRRRLTRINIDGQVTFTCFALARSIKLRAVYYCKSSTVFLSEDPSYRTIYSIYTCIIYMATLSNLHFEGCTVPLCVVGAALRGGVCTVQSALWRGQRSQTWEQGKRERANCNWMPRRGKKDMKHGNTNSSDVHCMKAESWCGMCRLLWIYSIYSIHSIYGFYGEE